MEMVTPRLATDAGSIPERHDDDRAPAGSGLEFYEGLPLITDFRALGDESVYVPLPGDWVVGVADIVASSEAVSAGHYKTVNTVAAAVIAALSNGLPGRDFPFVFAGDGAAFAVPAAQGKTGADILRAVARWARASFDLTLRVAIVPLPVIRASGHDVSIARYSPSPDVSYAMFGGGGLSFAERQMKAGAVSLDPNAGALAEPDLDGLYCRFAEIPATRGVILSIVVLPSAGAETKRFFDLTQEILAIAGEEGGNGNPVPADGPKQVWPSPGNGIEARLRSGGGRMPTWRARLEVLARSFLAHLTFLSGKRVGEFDPRRYRREIGRNTDFRKFGDGLLMTIDCSPALADRIEERLDMARAGGIARTGTHRQDAALMTCFVPSMSRSDHVHFVDGAAGGYAAATMAAQTVG